MLSAHAAHVQKRHPAHYSGRGYRTRLVSLRHQVVEGSRPGLIILMVAVLLLLLVAAVNTANLLLCEYFSRAHEFAVRGALGSGRGHLLRLVIAENSLIALLATAMGLFIAELGLHWLLALVPDNVPRLENVRIDGRVLGFSLSLSLVTWLIFALLPSLRGAKVNLRDALAAGRTGSARGAGSRTLRRLLVVGQIALAGTLTFSALLMIHTLKNLQAVQLGFEPRGVLTLEVSPTLIDYREPEKRLAFYDELSRRLAALPGVEAVGSSFALPFARPMSTWSIMVEATPAADIGDAPESRVQLADPGYFQAMGLELVAGRLLRSEDRADSTPVTVINETLARGLWPGEAALHRRFKVFSGDHPFMEVVGIVGDEKVDSPDEAPQSIFYVPLAQSHLTAFFTPAARQVVLRGTGTLLKFAPAIRDTVWSIDPKVPVTHFRTMEQITAEALATRRFTMTLLSIFGALALFLAAVGMYGVLSSSVNERRREIGVRQALGAGRRRVALAVAREGTILVLAGAAASVVIGIMLMRWMRSLLFGVSGWDVWALAGVFGSFVVVAGAASVMPALRASRVDPIEALRADR